MGVCVAQRRGQKWLSLSRASLQVRAWLPTSLPCLTAVRRPLSIPWDWRSSAPLCGVRGLALLTSNPTGHHCPLTPRVWALLFLLRVFSFTKWIPSTSLCLTHPTRPLSKVAIPLPRCPHPPPHLCWPSRGCAGVPWGLREQISASAPGSPFSGKVCLALDLTLGACVLPTASTQSGEMGTGLPGSPRARGPLGV